MANEIFGMEITDEMAEKEFSSTKNNGKNRGDRRKQDFSKARRKQRMRSDYYGNLHQYSKNKIHCSCRLCRGKDYFGRHITTRQEHRFDDKFHAEMEEMYAEENCDF